MTKICHKGSYFEILTQGNEFVTGILCNCCNDEFLQMLVIKTSFLI